MSTDKKDEKRELTNSYSKCGVDCYKDSLGDI